MARAQGGIVGRAAELRLLERAGDRRGAVVFVRGPAGLGKTTVLAQLARTWTARGVEVIRIACSPAPPKWDLLGGRAVVAACRNRFDELGDARVATAMAAVNRLCSPSSYRTVGTRNALFAELTGLFGILLTRGPVALLLDDVHTMPSPALAVAAAQQAGCTVVATCRDRTAEHEFSLDAVADRVIDLGPLSTAEIDELVARSSRLEPDAAVAPALRAALGSRAGNPGTVLQVVDMLRAQGRLVEFREHLCLTGQGAAIPLAEGDPLFAAVSALGGVGRSLVALVGTSKRISVGDLVFFAAVTDGDLITCGRTLDQLVGAGALACDSDGVLTVPCPALATAVLASLDRTEVEDLHARLAAHLREDSRSCLSRLADHLALAGPAGPASARSGRLLVDEADRLVGAEPETAARWYQAALRHLGPTHPTWPAVLLRLLHLLVRIGCYNQLADVVAEATAAPAALAAVHAGRPVPDDVHRVLGVSPVAYELAAAAALAAVHIGRPVPDEVHRSLSAFPVCGPPLRFVADWFAGRPPSCATEVAAVFGPFRADLPPDPGAGADELVTAGCRYDLVAVFRLVLGAAYGEPDNGPLADYHRVAEGYHQGDWPAALSAARNLELGPCPVTPIHHVTRLLAAEMCSCDGEFRRSAEWLAAGHGSPFPAMRAWAETGLLLRSGSLDEVFAVGTRGLDRARDLVGTGTPVGLPWLLTRLASVALTMGRDDHLRRMAVEAAEWRERHDGVGAQEAELLVRGLADGDVASTRAAIDLYRSRGSAVELLYACLAMARISGEPRQWFDEAYDIARRLGGDWLRTFVRTAMRERGLQPSRNRTAPGFSSTDERIIELVRRGLTNRQIATVVGLSEKAVENRLTRLFAQTGCRSRRDLATASLEGRLRPAVACGGWR